MQDHPLIELYINIDDDQQRRAVEQALESINLDDVVQRTLRAAGITQQVMLTLLVTDDEGIREMNRQYRQQDKATDVLSFPLLNAPLVQAPADQLWQPEKNESTDAEQFVAPPGPVLNLGDIVVSWPTIVQQATAAGHAPARELLYLLSHGVLHLIGYDDQTEAGYQAMIGIQNAVIFSLEQKN
ncbi:MAG: rRNA maturation RNase YbeY [Ktedonobacteraceae bacterium]|nr:rRNA maturation RNase YbeY [Ktedonobacteraceae bacterium]